MARNREQVIGAMKDALNSRIDEWVGMDIPDEGTEDYESWQSKLAEIDAIESIHDVIDYLESEGIDADDFFLNGEYELLSAGMAPEEIPQTVILNLGDLIAEHSATGKSASRVFLFDGTYFVIKGSKTTFFDKEHDAIKFAGIKGYQSNIGHHRQTASDVPEKLRDAEEDSSPVDAKPEPRKRPVLIVVPDWPDGTMAFKFGRAIQTALGVAREEMTLIQMSPERIFRAETAVSQAEFWERMRADGFGSITVVLFVELPTK